MNIAIDIGNTNAKLGIFAKNELKEVLSGNDIEKVLEKYKLQHAIISKTGNNDGFEMKLEAKKIRTFILTHSLKLPLEIQYSTPETLGSDRIAGSVGGKLLFPENNVLKIDFGTCITYDFINIKNQYLGGAISPGMMMRVKALHNYTAKLPLVDPLTFEPIGLIGYDTRSSMLSGVINGMKEEVDGIIKDYSLRFDNLKTVATGGDSGFFASLLKSEIFARPNLVLEGLNTILNYNL